MIGAPAVAALNLQAPYRLSRSGSLAMFAAMRRASSRVISLAAVAPAGLLLVIDVRSACPLASLTMKQAGRSSTDHGGGKRTRGGHLPDI